MKAGVVALLVAGLLAVAGQAEASPSGPSAKFAGAVGLRGTSLTLNGVPHHFVGVNAYELGTDWGVNAGCGGMETDAQLRQFFASLPPDSLVRFWAFQGTIGTNYTTHQLDWRPMDRVFASATAHHQHLILSVSDQAGTCDNGHWQDPAWYSGQFRMTFNARSNTAGESTTPVPYYSYLSALVGHFKSSPALAMWEPMSEAEASSCPGQFQPVLCGGHQTCPSEKEAAQALRHFFDVVGAGIHRLDPAHPVEDGLLSGGQCGIAGSDWSYVSASPGIDVLSYHDYYAPTVAIGGDQWNGEGLRLAQARALGKPVIAGEIGIEATASGRGQGGMTCPTYAQRAHDLAHKAQAQFAAGASAALWWNWELDQGTGCSYNITPQDPAMAVLHQL